MSIFAVVREAGPGWTAGGISDQAGLDEHAAFMNRLADDGFVMLGGPLAGTEHGRIRVLLVVNADTEAQIQSCLADDPWTSSRRLRVVRIEPWKLLVGAERLALVGRA